MINIIIQITVVMIAISVTINTQDNNQWNDNYNTDRDIISMVNRYDQCYNFQSKHESDYSTNSNLILIEPITVHSFRQYITYLLNPFIFCFIASIITLLNYSNTSSQATSSQATSSQATKRKKKSKNYFIFGYGSLINQESRKQTGITGKAITVRVHHLKRGWIYDVDTLHHPQISNTPFTAVGAQIDKNNFDSSVNGVIFPLQYEEIAKYDQREARYQRYEINHKDIEILDGNDNDSFCLDENSIVYVYIVPDEIALPLDDEYKNKRILKQSYIDKILSGCLSVDGYEFALECIDNTFGWNAIYENDRDSSSFSKEKISPEIIQKIDEMMDKYLPHLRQLN